ncbi:MAG: TetR/AcrR family transcriptional regulator [Hyphomonadaceae bacterium]|nr:TetR/AcrR family transcriptional regulator [Hyphomonadaceae bacterium]
MRRLLDAAALEFGERGFHEASIATLTARAGVSIGSFYVYFDSKEAIFRALVADMGHMTRAWIAERVKDAPDRLAAERLGIAAFIEFVRAHKNLYRVVMESQFVAEDAYRAYYDTWAASYERNLASAARKGEIRDGEHAARTWAMLGMSVFLGMRYGVWDEADDAMAVAEVAADLLERGLAPDKKRKRDGSTT